jgi:hypothetical protein
MKKVRQCCLSKAGARLSTRSRQLTTQIHTCDTTGIRAVDSYWHTSSTARCVGDGPRIHVHHQQVAAACHRQGRESIDPGECKTMSTTSFHDNVGHYTQYIDSAGLPNR